MRSRTLRPLVAALAGATAMASLVLTSPEPAAAATKTFSMAQCSSVVNGVARGCETPLEKIFIWLRPGDTLTIAPGTYDVGNLGVNTRLADMTGRITITAADPSRPPTLRGRVQLWKPRNVTLSNLRLEATLAGSPALSSVCGTGWEVRNSHIFGASKTGSYSNFTIAGNASDCPGEPRDFRVSENVFTDPYTDPTLHDHPDMSVRATAVIYHHIYATFNGTPGTGGVIERNVFVGNRNGAGVKLGNLKGELGPANVRVRFNSFYDGVWAVLLAYDSRNHVIEGNLVDRMRGGPKSAYGAAVAVSELTTVSNTVANNYGYNVQKNWADLKTGSTVNEAANVLGPSPLYTGWLLQPTRPEAQPYGRWGTGAFPG